jgi:Ca2+-binding EF-hand superfamily protein
MISGINQYTNYLSAIDSTPAKDREEEMFTNIDTIGDGVIDKAEFSAFGQQMAAKIGKADKSEEIFSQMDTDGDGQVSKAEFEAFAAKMKDHMKNRPSPKEMFAKIDSNGDGIIDKSEFAAFEQKRAEKTDTANRSDDIFSQMDTDGDGQISKAEFVAFGEKMKNNSKDETPIDANAVTGEKNESISTLLDALNQSGNSDGSLENTVQQYVANINASLQPSNLNLLG